MNVKVISGFLNALAVAASNPVFSGSGLAVSAALRLGASLIDSGEQGLEGLRKLTEEIEQMVADGREPTAQEWKGLRQRSDAAHKIIQGTAPPTVPAPGTAPEGVAPANPPATPATTPTVPDTRGCGVAVPAVGSRQPVPNAALASEHRDTPTERSATVSPPVVAQAAVVTPENVHGGTQPQVTKVVRSEGTG